MDEKEKIIETMGGALQRPHLDTKPFYVTTPIYYVNDKPHIGHAYTTIVGDVVARYRRMRGIDVAYVTGTDENSQKSVEAAEKVGRGDDDMGYMDEMSAVWARTWDDLDITNTDFIRTTQERHLKGVEKFWNTVQAQGDIYKGTYVGWYCVGCEAFLKESDLEDEKCPTHKKKVEKIEEENYFFKLTKYRDALLAYITAHPEFVAPAARKHEIISYIKDFMEDISISRHHGKIGIAVPGDSEHKIYVWFDALINYLTAVGYGTDDDMFDRHWPADLHLVGKDIIKFHCALWPAMLMAAGVPLPRQVYAHGFFTIDGVKMSKSLGNVIDPVVLSEEVGMDTLRYFLLREISFGGDGDFSKDRLVDRYNTELANELGNLVHRVLSMTEKYCDGKVTDIPAEHDEIPWDAYIEYMERLQFGRVLDEVWQVIRAANKFIEDEKPWSVYKEQPERAQQILAHLLETLRQIAWMLLPITPHISEGIFTQLGLDATVEMEKDFDDARQWGGLEKGTSIAKADPLFPRLS